MSTHLACHTCNEMTSSDKINYCDDCGLAFCNKHGTHLRYPDVIEDCFFCARCMDEDDDEILKDEYVVEAIIDREEHELLDEIEGDKQAIEYFSSEHSDEFGEKGKKRLEDMRKELL